MFRRVLRRGFQKAALEGNERAGARLVRGTPSCAREKGSMDGTPKASGRGGCTCGLGHARRMWDENQSMFMAYCKLLYGFTVVIAQERAKQRNRACPVKVLTQKSKI